jgi:hypothetical protein
MNVERLKNLLRVLEEVKERQLPFEMQWWFSRDGVSSGDECGSAACALGWACRDPWFQEQGLQSDDVTNEPMYDGDCGLVAGMRLFELTYSESADLFFACNYPIRSRVTIDDVMKRVRQQLGNE